ncbi:MAG: hypothetical protein M3Z37_07545 [Candidatus Eremiobacteraeota bacterium]|nr:hypothetical protein [Candidatus Eremiobacteraeota bacterium]
MDSRWRLRAGLAVLFLFITLLGWRSVAAWFADDAGNLALFKGRSADAARWFRSGLQAEPGWGLLHEDLGRALLATDPRSALDEFRIAACGPACAAEEGDALLRLGRRDEAIERYVASRAVVRVGQRAQEIAAAGDDHQAIALETSLLARLHDSFLERAQLASTYAALGDLELGAAYRHPAEAAVLRRAAIGALRRASALAPFNERFLLLYAFAQIQWGDRAEARVAFQRLLRLHPHLAAAESALSKLEGPRAPAP